MARGVFFTVVFTGIGLIQLVTSYLSNSPDILTGQALSAMVTLNVVATVLAGIFVVLTGVYGGFVNNVSAVSGP